jgi:hypothetical protein
VSLKRLPRQVTEKAKLAGDESQKRLP